MIKNLILLNHVPDFNAKKIAGKTLYLSIGVYVYLKTDNEEKDNVCQLASGAPS